MLTNANKEYIAPDWGKINESFEESGAGVSWKLIDYSVSRINESQEKSEAVMLRSGLNKKSMELRISDRASALVSEKDVIKKILKEFEAEATNYGVDKSSLNRIVQSSVQMAKSSSKKEAEVKKIEAQANEVRKQKAHLTQQVRALAKEEKKETNQMETWRINAPVSQPTVVDRGTLTLRANLVNQPPPFEDLTQDQKEYAKHLLVKDLDMSLRDIANVHKSVRKHEYVPRPEVNSSLMKVYRRVGGLDDNTSSRVFDPKVDVIHPLFDNNALHTEFALHRKLLFEIFPILHDASKVQREIDVVVPYGTPRNSLILFTNPSTKVETFGVPSEDLKGRHTNNLVIEYIPWYEAFGSIQDFIRTYRSHVVKYMFERSNRLRIAASYYTRKLDPVKSIKYYADLQSRSTYEGTVVEYFKYWLGVSGANDFVIATVETDRGISSNGMATIAKHFLDAYADDMSKMQEKEEHKPVPVKPAAASLDFTVYLKEDETMTAPGALFSADETVAERVKFYHMFVEMLLALESRGCNIAGVPFTLSSRCIDDLISIEVDIRCLFNSANGLNDLGLGPHDIDQADILKVEKAVGFKIPHLTTDSKPIRCVLYMIKEKLRIEPAVVVEFARKFECPIPNAPVINAPPAQAVTNAPAQKQVPTPLPPNKPPPTADKPKAVPVPKSKEQTKGSVKKEKPVKEGKKDKTNAKSTDKKVPNVQKAKETVPPKKKLGDLKVVTTYKSEFIYKEWLAKVKLSRPIFANLDKLVVHEVQWSNNVIASLKDMIFCSRSGFVYPDFRKPQFRGRIVQFSAHATIGKEQFPIGIFTYWVSSSTIKINYQGENEYALSKVWEEIPAFFGDLPMHDGEAGNEDSDLMDSLETDVKKAVASKSDQAKIRSAYQGDNVVRDFVSLHSHEHCVFKEDGYYLEHNTHGRIKWIPQNSRLCYPANLDMRKSCELEILPGNLVRYINSPCPTREVPWVEIACGSRVVLIDKSSIAAVINGAQLRTQNVTIAASIMNQIATFKLPPAVLHQCKGNLVSYITQAVQKEVEAMTSRVAGLYTSSKLYAETISSLNSSWIYALWIKLSMPSALRVLTVANFLRFGLSNIISLFIMSLVVRKFLYTFDWLDLHSYEHLFFDTVTAVEIGYWTFLSLFMWCAIGELLTLGRDAFSVESLDFKHPGFSLQAFLFYKLNEVFRLDLFVRCVSWCDDSSWILGLGCRFLWPVFIALALYNKGHVEESDDEEVVPFHRNMKEVGRSEAPRSSRDNKYEHVHHYVPASEEVYQDLKDVVGSSSATLYRDKLEKLGFSQYSAFSLPNLKYKSPIRPGAEIRTWNLPGAEPYELLGNKSSFWEKSKSFIPYPHPGAYRHGGIRGCVPILLNKACPFNFIAAVRERFVKERRVPSPGFAQRFSQSMRQLSALIPYVICTHADEEQWLQTRPSYKKVRSRDAFEKVKSRGYDLRDTNRLSGFVKDEMALKASVRLICMPSDDFNAYFGPWCSVFEKQASESIKTELRNVCLSGSTTNEQKGSWYYENIYLHDCWVFDIDASRWDASVPDAMINALYQCYIDLGWSDSEFLDRRRNFIMDKRFGNTRIKVTSHGRYVASGCPDTYIGNTLMNLALLRSTFSILIGSNSTYNGLNIDEVRMMICGDDALVAIPKRFLNGKPRIEDVIQVLERSGMDFEINLNDNASHHKVSFCSSVFLPFSVGNEMSMCLVPLPHRFFGKSYHIVPESMRNITPIEHHDALEFSGLYLYSKDPYFKRFFDPRTKINYRQYEHVIKTKWYMRYETEFSTNYKSDKTKYDILMAYDFWNKIYPGLPPPSVVVHPLWFGKFMPKEFSDPMLPSIPSLGETVNKSLHIIDGFSHPFAVNVLLEEMDLPDNRMMRDYLESFENTGLTPYPARANNNHPYALRARKHLEWNSKCVDWNEKLNSGEFETFYLAAAWKSDIIDVNSVITWDRRSDLQEFDAFSYEFV